MDPVYGSQGQSSLHQALRRGIPLKTLFQNLQRGSFSFFSIVRLRQALDGCFRLWINLEVSCLNSSNKLQRTFPSSLTLKGEIRRQFLRRRESLFCFLETEKWFLVSERWKTLQIAPRNRESQSMDWRSHSTNKDKTLSINHQYQGPYYAEMFSGRMSRSNIIHVYIFDCNLLGRLRIRTFV